MIQLTLGEARPEIARRCGDAGLPVTDAAVIARINRAIQELANTGDYPNIVDRWRIVSADGLVVLPTHLDRLMQINVRGIPQVITSPWYQFVAYGPGTREDQQGFARWWTDESTIIDRGEYPSRNILADYDLVGPWYIRIYTAVTEEADAYCTVQGLNEDGEIIRTQEGGEWINGERIVLNGAVPYVQGTELFESISAFTKPVTNGYIRMTAYNGTDEVELSNYLPTDTTPSYHRYFSQWLADLDAADDSPLRVIQARCRRRYVPASEDTDVLLVSNLPALAEMVIAQYKRDSDDMESYLAHRGTSVQLMREEANAYRGKSRIPGLTFQRGYPIGSGIPALR
jgi:hypothetical protein